MPFSDLNAKTDSYVGINVGGRYKRSKIKENTLSPMWNEILTFKTYFPSNLDLSNDISIQIFNYNQWKDDLIGKNNINFYLNELIFRK